MPLRSPAEKKTAAAFLKKLATRLKSPAIEARVSVSLGEPTKAKRPSGTPAPVPKHDDVHLFDEGTVGILGGLIEEMALGAKGGSWTATIGAFSGFDSLRPRYAALGKALDSVRVWGSGPAPKQVPGVDLLAIDSPILAHYRLVLFEGPKESAVLLVKEIPAAKGSAGRRYVGFYSFCPFLLRSVQQRLHLVGCGLHCMLKEWEKAFNLPKIAAGDLASLESACSGAPAKAPAKKAAAKAKTKAKPAPKAKAKAPARKRVAVA